MPTDDFLSYAGRTDAGYKRKLNEDWITIDGKSFGDDVFFAAIADGMGSGKGAFRASGIVCEEVLKFLKKVWEKKPKLFMEQYRLLLELAFSVANDVLIGFKVGDEEETIGYATTLTAALVMRDGTLCLAHCGNTRLHVVKPDGRVLQLTNDMTEGARKLRKKEITETDYYHSLSKAVLYSCVGADPEIPEIQTLKVRLEPNDVIIMTTDGVHNSYASGAFYDIMTTTEAASMDAYVDRIINTAKELKNVADNEGAIVIWYKGPNGG